MRLQVYSFLFGQPTVISRLKRESPVLYKNRLVLFDILYWLIRLEPRCNWQISKLTLATLVVVYISVHWDRGLLASWITRCLPIDSTSPTILLIKMLPTNPRTKDLIELHFNSLTYAILLCTCKCLLHYFVCFISGHFLSQRLGDRQKALELH